MGSLGVFDSIPGPDSLLFSKDHATSAVTEVGHNAQTSERWLVQSPYTEKEHLLDLDTLDHENRLLARALTRFRVLRNDYATSPYVKTFNWQEVMDELKKLVQESKKGYKESCFYIVAFRSQIKPSTEYGDLGRLDKAAHAEAIASGGFLKYWFGEPDSALRNLATCIWRSRDDARNGGKGPAHRQAAGATRSLYQLWKIDQHRLIVRDNVAAWEIVPWQD